MAVCISWLVLKGYLVSKRIHGFVLTMFLRSSWATFPVLRIVSFCSRSIKASHILISGDGLVTLSGLSHLHSLIKHGQRHRAVFDFPQFSTSVQPWLSPELLRQVRCGRCIGLSVRLKCLLSLTEGQLCFYIWIGEWPPARLFSLVKMMLGILNCISYIK